MGERFISSVHVEKLGHKIQEIRERALHNIISKLDHGFVYDNDLARSKEILSKLFDWFSFEPHTKEDVVLQLIKRILETECGLALMKHYGANVVKNQLKDVQAQVHERHHSVIAKMLAFVDANVLNQVPRLEPELPLSHRTNSSSEYVGTTATSIRGQIYQPESVEQRAGAMNNEEMLSTCFPNYVLPWHTLISSDRHVLDSVEESLTNPPQPALLLHSCEFFIDVMLHDFPAEIFLQRPGIVVSVQRLIAKYDSIRIKSAALNCLLNLTKSLCTRINFHSDPSTYNLKQYDFSEIHSERQVHSSHYYMDSYRHRTKVNNGNLQPANTEDAVSLQNNQLSLPEYCLNTFGCVLNFLNTKYEHMNDTKRKKSQVALNLCLMLFDRTIVLLKLCITEEVWSHKNNGVVGDFVYKLTDTFGKLGEILEFYRLEVMSNDCDSPLRCAHLHLLYSCVAILSAFVPLSKADFVLPRSFKSALGNAVLDCSFAKLYTNAHGTLVEYTQSFTGRCQSDSLKRYNDIKSICASVTAAITFIRNGKTMPVTESVPLAREGLQSLEFHRHDSYMKVFVEICANVLPMSHVSPDVQSSVDYVILSLLSYNDPSIREEMYIACHKRVISAIGPKLNATKTSVPGSQILFLLRPEIIGEIATFGLTSENKKISKCADDILIHILKCKILVNDNVWNCVVESLIPTIPLLLCHAGKNDALGRTLLGILDPDKASDLYIAPLEVLKGNACLLFADDALARNEAVSRLSWLLASDRDAKNLLPKISSLQDKTSSSACILKRTSDVNKTRGQQHFYPPSALVQVLELLNSDAVEPVIRRSAITQVSVMMEDPLLHATFLESDGLRIVLKVARSALTETSFKDYPDSVIPAVCVLKNVCLHCPTVRQELAIDSEALFLVLRGLFMYCTEGRMKQDGSSLLFLLLYANFVHGNPANGDLSLPHIVFDKLYVPFTCNVHWKCSKYYLPSLAAVLLSDKWCNASLQIHWNSEWRGGFQQLLLNCELEDDGDYDPRLKLSTGLLRVLRNSSVELNVKSLLAEVQKSNTHATINSGINKLIMFLNLHEKVSSLKSTTSVLLSYDWEKTFVRFLSAPAASEEDALLLTNVLKCLTVLAKFYKITEECWITAFLTTPSCLLTDLLQNVREKQENKLLLHQELLSLITVCACKGQHYLDFYSTAKTAQQELSWNHVVTDLVKTLQFNDAQHFYNLAYLDCSLQCLLHLTSTLGWSNGNKAGDLVAKPFLKQLVSELFQLVEAFHCGKGQSATSSFMGLSVTRNVMLILNHILAELQFSNVKTELWESCFLEKNIGGHNITSLWTLWNSRDVILRASVVQLFAGIATSPNCTNALFNDVRTENKGILDYCLEVLVDHTEANIVREKVANLLTNMLSNINLEKTKQSSPFSKCYQGSDIVQNILKTVANYDFYKESETILLGLYVKNKLMESKKEATQISIDDSIALLKTNSSTTNTFMYPENVLKSARSVLTENGSSSSIESADKRNTLTTPCLIKCTCTLMCNLINLSPGIVTSNLNDYGLIKLYFRCISDPCMEIKNTKDLMLYTDLLEMNAAICCLLRRSAAENSNSLTSILHAKDCLFNVVGLLDPNLYYVTLPQLEYLRNKLWSEIFFLLIALLEDNGTCSLQEEVTSTICGILQESGHEAFLRTLCESMLSNSNVELQAAALTTLTSLLRWETRNNNNELMRRLLDHVEISPLTRRKSHESISVSSPKNRRKQEKLDLLEDLYFPRNYDSNRTLVKRVSDKGAKAGATVCEILLELYDVVSLKSESKTGNAKKKHSILGALTSVLCVSKEAKTCALEAGLMDVVVGQLKDVHVKLSLDTPDCLRRVSGKKKLSPLLKELHALLGLASNFTLDSQAAKRSAASLGLADVLHKLWVWLPGQRTLLVTGLKLLCTFTADCALAAQSLALTSSVAGSGPRKVPSNVSLLHAVVLMVAREMDQVSRTHDLTLLELLFHLLRNSCDVLECRAIICKSNLLQQLSRLHPAVTKRQKPWDSVELLWIGFLETFTCHAEGQSFVAKFPDALELIITFANGPKSLNRQTSMYVLRNVAFYPSNRSRLLTSDEFLSILQLKLANGSYEEINVVVLMIWALIANNQKSKLVIKSAGLDLKLHDTVKLLTLSKNDEIKEEDLDRMHYVLNLLKDGDNKC